MAKKLMEVPARKPVVTVALDAATAAKRSPTRIIRIEDCSASIWARDVLVRGKPTRFFSVTLERSYKDRDGGWKWTKSFDGESLGKVMELCQQAREAIESLAAEFAEQHEAA